MSSSRVDQRFCVSLGVDTVAGVRKQAEALRPEINCVELRLDLLDPRESASDAWRELPSTTVQEWVLTWRSPAEGGAAPRPQGILEKGLAAGYRWIDVEARALENGDPEVAGIPVARRWVSHHSGTPPKTAAELEAGWHRVKQSPGALHKYVTVADRFEVNTWVLDLLDREGSGGAVTIFARGWVGHPSRVLGFLHGNAMTFVAGEETLATAEGQPSVRGVLDEYALSRLSASPEIYGVLGNPARHSRSPALQNHGFRILGKDALYLPLESATPEPIVAWLREGRLSGISVTAPFKESMITLVDQVTPEAEALGAINTVWKQGEYLVGGNTDLGAAYDLLAPHAGSPDSRLAVVGAGGAAAAVLGAAGQLQLDAVVYNRSAPRGKNRARQFKAGWGGDPAGLTPEEFSVIANTTPVTADHGMTLDSRLLSSTTVLDLSYDTTPTIWETAARKSGSPFHGGLEFLARQGVGQLHRWTGEDLSWKQLIEGLDL